MRELREWPDKDGVDNHGRDTFYHGTSDTTKVQSGLRKAGYVYLTKEKDEAEGFANNVHRPGASVGKKAGVMTILAKPGKTVSIDNEMADEIENGDGSKESEEKIMQGARDKGARYATHYHPSSVSGKGGFTAHISLYPHEDLKVSGGYWLKAKESSVEDEARDEKGRWTTSGLSEDEKKVAHARLDKLGKFENENFPGRNDVAAHEVFGTDHPVSAIFRGKDKGGTIHSIKLSSLTPGQEAIPREGLNKYIDDLHGNALDKGIPMVVTYQGHNFIQEGHTRLGALKLGGREEAIVRHFQADAKGHLTKFKESALESLVTLLEAKSKLAGPMSLAAEIREKKFAKQLGSYFTRLKTSILSTNVATAPDKYHAAKYCEKAVVDASTSLKKLYAEHLKDCMLAADKLEIMHESFFQEDDPTWPIDQLGLSGEEAADWASEYAAKKVVGVDKVTVETIANLVSDGITNLDTIQQIKKSIADSLDMMSTKRSMTIARTETADAFGEAALRKINRMGIEGKQLIPSPDACPECLEIAMGGPIPVDEPFNDDGDMRSPIHVNCRCATVGARLPASED